MLFKISCSEAYCGFLNA